jgi:hypothetical protein
MKTLYLRIAVALIGIAALGGTTKAQTADHLVVAVPFQFVVGGTTFPAGTYRVHRLTETDPSGGLVLTTYDNRVVATVLPIDVEGARDNNPKVSFEIAAGQHFLNRIQTAENIFDIPVARSTSTVVAANNTGASFGNSGSK